MTMPSVHALTSLFGSTLDEIPQDMCRHFADLRELDAVLSASLNSITLRINQLTDQIEANIDAPQGDKSKDTVELFHALHEIAEDLRNIKPGGEDKIRVASLAAEHMNAYYNHLEHLVSQMEELDDAFALSVLAPKTQYPHVPPSALIEPTPENRRGAPRRVGAQYNPNGNQNGNGQNGRTSESPAKRRRPQHNRDDTDESTPRRGVAALDAEAYKPGGAGGNSGTSRRGGAGHGTGGRRGGRGAAPVNQHQRHLDDPNGPPNEEQFYQYPGFVTRSPPPKQFVTQFAPAPYPAPQYNPAPNGRLSPTLIQYGPPVGMPTTLPPPPARHGPKPHTISQDIQPPTYSTGLGLSSASSNPNPNGLVPTPMTLPPVNMIARAPPPPTSLVSNPYYADSSMGTSMLPNQRPQSSGMGMSMGPNSNVSSGPRPPSSGHGHPSSMPSVHPPSIPSGPRERDGYRDAIVDPNLAKTTPRMSSGPPPSNLQTQTQPQTQPQPQHNPYTQPRRTNHNGNPSRSGFADEMGHQDGPGMPRERVDMMLAEPAQLREAGSDGGFGGMMGSDEVVDGDDNKPYCICGRPSFGPMIGCDDSECEYEWFHWPCLGITTSPPQGEYICDSCKIRRAKGHRKGGKKKGNGQGRVKAA